MFTLIVMYVNIFQILFNFRVSRLFVQKHGVNAVRFSNGIVGFSTKIVDGVGFSSIFLYGNPMLSPTLSGVSQIEKGLFHNGLSLF